MSKPKQATILAIETSADETSAAVLNGPVILEGAKATDRISRDSIASLQNDTRLKSNIIYSQIAKHRKTGGIVPEVAARAHIPKIIPALKLALAKAGLAPAKAGVKLKSIDAMAVTVGPGLITSLMIGIDTAKAIAFALGKPIIPINHLEGHLLSALPGANSKFEIRNSKLLPAVGLVVSGGHTMLVLVNDIGKYKILGETLDDAAGEAFDKIAKILGLSYPGGPALAKLAEKGNPEKYDMPRPMLDKNNYDFSFSGLKTHVLYLWREIRPLPPSGYPPQAWGGKKGGVEKQKADIAAGAQQAIVDVLVEKTIRAAHQYKAKSVLLGGGVAANKKLRQTLEARVKKETNSYLLTPNSSLTTDNAGMIAYAAYYHFRYGHVSTYDKVRVNPNLELKSWR